jgi:glycosyltransferase involved in cell wall biosynthesis
VDPATYSAAPARPRLLLIGGYPSPGRGPTGIGGCELQAHRVARLLTHQFDVRVLSDRLPGLDSMDVLDGVRIDRIPLHSAGTVPAILHAGRTVAWGLRSGRPDIIQGFQLNGVTIAAAALALLHRVPLVIKVADRVNIQRLLPSRSGRAKLRFLMQSASAVVAPSATCLGDLRALNLPEQKLHLVQNGVDIDRFRPSSPAERSTARRTLGLGDQDFVFAWVARLDPRKGFYRVCRVWGRLVELRPHARLVVAGAGQENGLAEALSREQHETVRWLKLLDDVRPVYAAADAVLIASSSEGLSNTLLEGMAAGLPAVVSAIPENLEVDPDGRFVIPFSQESPEALLEALVEMIDRKSILASRRAQARARAKSQYSLSITAERWAQLYRTIVPVASR